MVRSSLSAGLGALACLTACAHPYSERPNVVLVSIDSLRPDHLHCYGYARETSPTIDALAASGVRFECAVSTTSWTLPAHAALFTGLYDESHGLIDNGLRLAPGLRTLAERMQELGYHTAGFYGGPYLHPTFGLGDGFEHYQSCMTKVPAELGEDVVRQESRAPNGWSHDDVTGPRTVAEVERWSETRPADRPFFLFVHLWDVHYDFIPPEPWDKRFDPDYTGSADGRGFMLKPEVGAGMLMRDLEHIVALYDGEIGFTDDNLGQILSGLRARGMLENTLLVVTADHGEEFFEHGGKGHQATLFDEVLRVPLVLSWPGHIESGRVVADQVRLVDLAPTILRAAGARDLGPMQGRDILPLARGEHLEPASALAELHADERDFHALRTLDFKVIDYGHAPDGREHPGTGFDLVRDPGELQPIRPRDHSARMTAAKDELARAIQAAKALHDYLGAQSPEAEVDPELERTLRQLGYLGDAQDH